MAKHFLGQTSTQALQEMQRSRSMLHSVLGFDTVIAPVGHLRWQIPQKIHWLISIWMLPRVRGEYVFGPNGYFSVAGGRRRLLNNVFVIVKIGIVLPSLNLLAFGKFLLKFAKHK